MKYKITDGSISLGGKTILSHFDFEIKGREKLALVGQNGCGKTTLLRLIAGELSMDRDDKRKLPVISKSSDFTIAILNQHVFSTDEELEHTVEEVLLDACPCKDRFDRERFLYEKEYDNLFTGFGFTKEDKKRKLATFSGGQKTRIALIRLLLEKPDLLLLDEPTNHLDEEMTEWLEEWIRSYEKAVLMVSHDRYFLDETADGIYEVVDHKLVRYSGNYSAYVEEKQKKREILLKAWEREQEEIKRLEDLIKKFKNKPKKAAFARSRQKILDRMEHMEKPSGSELRPFKEEIVPALRSSKYVLEAEELGIGYDHAILQLSLRIRRGQKIGVIGKNGIGKSTFLKTAAGLLSPVNGRCLPGINVTQTYFDQNSAEFQSDLTVIDHFKAKFPSMTDKDARATLGRWMFGGREAMKKISDLSGGERSRLHFAELFMECPNFMIIDEPTNHMDIRAREMLESAFVAYQGTLLVVSHDRYFINRVADSLLVLDDDGATYYPFGYRRYKARKDSAVPGGIPAADKKLLDEVKNVPEAEKGRLKRISDHAVYTDWRLGLMEEDLDSVMEAVSEAEEAYTLSDLVLYEKDAEERAAEKEKLLNRLDALYTDWTKKCIEYDEFMTELSEEEEKAILEEAEDESEEGFEDFDEEMDAEDL